MNDPEPLINDFLEDRLDEAGQTALSAWVKQYPSHLRRFTRAVMFDQEIRAVVQAREGSNPASGMKVTFPRGEDTPAASASPIQFPYAGKTPGYFGRAAAWFGAFTWFIHQAEAASAASAAKSTSFLKQASTMILMKKTITSITAAIIVLGGAGIYVIHHGNESSKARVVAMEAEIQLLSDQLGIQTTRSASRRPSASKSPKMVPITQVISIYNGGAGLSPEEIAILEQFKKQLAEMDAESLKNMLLDVEKSATRSMNILRERSWMR